MRIPESAIYHVAARLLCEKADLDPVEVLGGNGSPVSAGWRARELVRCADTAIALAAVVSDRLDCWDKP